MREGGGGREGEREGLTISIRNGVRDSRICHCTHETIIYTTNSSSSLKLHGIITTSKRYKSDVEEMRVTTSNIWIIIA